MSGAAIDLTARARIRALAARMHRAGITNVFSIAGGAPAVDEDALTATQRSEAAKILEEVADTSDDVASLARVASMIPHYVKPSCSICHGGGVVLRGGADDFCVCVDRRWQAAADHQAFVDGLRAPGRSFGARVESTRADKGARATAARDDLARARAAMATACADIDAEIAQVTDGAAEYFRLRGQAETDRAAWADRAVEKETSAVAYAQAAMAAQDRAEEAVLRVGQAVQARLEGRGSTIDALIEEQGRVVADIAVFYDEVAAAERRRVDWFDAGAEAREYRDRECAARDEVARLDRENSLAVVALAQLNARRAQVAKHHQPKIVRAEKRLRRLVYLSDVDPGDASTAVVGAAEDDRSGKVSV